MAPISFYVTILLTFGLKVVIEMKRYHRNTIKLAKQQSRKEFLLQCRRKKIFPKHLVTSLNSLEVLLTHEHPYKNKVEDIFNKFLREVLNVEIQITFSNINSIKKENNDISAGLRDVLDQETFKSFMESQGNCFKNVLNCKRNECGKKLDSLYNLKKNNALIGNGLLIESQSVVNFSPIELPPKFVNLLSLGPKFALNSSNNIPISRMICDTECIVNSMPSQVKDVVRSKIVNVVTNRLNNQRFFKQTDREKTTSGLFSFAKNFLLQKSEEGAKLVIVKSDKGGNSCVLTEEQYQQSARTLLNDRTTYREVDKDPTTRLKNRNNKLVTEMFESECIDMKTRDNLLSKTPNPPKLYLLPKTHKKGDNGGIACRPVISCIGSPVYKLSKFLSNILSKAFTSKFNVNNSKEFVEKVKKCKVPPGYRMVSFDVKSLFSNIPTALLIKCIENNWNNIKDCTSIPKYLFLRAVVFVVNNSFFSFSGKIFLQWSGLPMGDPMSPICADYVMESLLDSIIEKSGVDFLCLFKYVDDIFAILPIDKIDHILNLLNEFHPKLNFTIENEENNQLPFLDVLVSHNVDGFISTTWYSKNNHHSVKILNYFSEHSMKTKLGVVTGFMHRVKNSYSGEDFDSQFDLISTVLKRNNYPSSLIRKVFQNVKNSGVIRERRIETDVRYCSFPYIPQLSENVNKIVRKYAPDVVLSFRNVCSVSDVFTNMKDKIPLLKQSGVVYSVECQCNKKYIGMTAQYLESRIKQHQNDVKNVVKNARECKIDHNNILGTAMAAMQDVGEGFNDKDIKKKNDIRKLYKSCEKSGLTTHFSITGHNFDFANVKVLDREKNWYKRSVLEMINVHLCDNVNKKCDSEALSPAYSGLLDVIRSRNRV